MTLVRCALLEFRTLSADFRSLAGEMAIQGARPCSPA